MLGIKLSSFPAIRCIGLINVHSRIRPRWLKGSCEAPRFRYNPWHSWIHHLQLIEGKTNRSWKETTDLTERDWHVLDTSDAASPILKKFVAAWILGYMIKYIHHSKHLRRTDEWGKMKASTCVVLSSTGDWIWFERQSQSLSTTGLNTIGLDGLKWFSQCRLKMHACIDECILMCMGSYCVWVIIVYT